MSPTQLDPIELELIWQRFSALTAEMGAALQRTALSTNIRERLDFSCALLDPGGELIANAPHIPVHLGALGLCVRQVAKVHPFEVGDSVITNHPAFGGSHLPDVTVITAVGNGLDGLLGYVASRAHHAEIGGKRPGSMPPDAVNLAEEGVVIPPTLLARAGRAQWSSLRAMLEGGEYPSRAVSENLADVQAALAANTLGSRSLEALATEIGLAVLKAGMEQLKSLAREEVRRAFVDLGQQVLRATEFLDDGSKLTVKIRRSPHFTDRVSFDFTGSSGVHQGSFNATPAIVRSAVLYVVRVLIAKNLPLNEGLLREVDIVVPTGILNPQFRSDPKLCPAVVAGNVETSQRIVDLLFKALEIGACSQGTMNNVLFGNSRFGYYETICGGVGAGSWGPGADAVHSHMTNTRITDPEVLELRYPVRLERFAIRRGSGGAGSASGGDGVIRELRFLEPVSLSLLSQHRVERPFGCAGGKPGMPGTQRIIRLNGEVLELRGCDTAELEAGDLLRIETPGGGGYGHPGMAGKPLVETEHDVAGSYIDLEA